MLDDESQSPYVDCVSHSEDIQTIRSYTKQYKNSRDLNNTENIDKTSQNGATRTCDLSNMAESAKALRNNNIPSVGDVGFDDSVLVASVAQATGSNGIQVVEYMRLELMTSTLPA